MSPDDGDGIMMTIMKMIIDHFCIALICVRNELAVFNTASVNNNIEKQH